jgi:hypothetical protein
MVAECNDDDQSDMEMVAKCKDDEMISRLTSCSRSTNSHQSSLGTKARFKRIQQRGTCCSEIVTRYQWVMRQWVQWERAILACNLCGRHVLNGRHFWCLITTQTKRSSSLVVFIYRYQSCGVSPPHMLPPKACRIHAP